MWPDDMPDPSDTRRWTQWFQQQDPSVQQEVVFNFGLSDANAPVAGNDIGTMQPEIMPQGYGMLSQMQSPPVINSKGVVQPYGTEQQAKRLNLYQDQNSLLIDNVMAAIAGQYAPTAFTPSYEPQGNPIQATGLRQLQSLANTGGWEGFMASQMLPAEYGGGGMSASQAKGALMKAVMTPDNADEQALSLREELRGSLTPRYETQGTSNNPQYTPPIKDLTTAQGIANSFDLSDVDEVSRGWQKELASDPIAGYVDPTTGLSYVGAKENKTPTMDWFDKYGLPYANKSYADPDQIANMQDAVAPWEYQGQPQMEELQRQDALGANAAARGELGQAQNQMDVLEKAYKQAMKVNPWPERTDTSSFNPANPMNGAVNVPDRSTNVPGAILNGFGMNPGGLYSPPANYDVLRQQANAPVTAAETKTLPARFYMDLDAQGNPTRLSLNQSQPVGSINKPVAKHRDGRTTFENQPGVKMGAGLTGDTNFDFGEPGAVVPGLDVEHLTKLIPGLDRAFSRRKMMTADDLAPARQRVEMARKAAAKTVPGIQAASKSSPTAFARQMEQARMIGLSLTGRTPLTDTLAGRMMAARSAGVYG